MKLAEEHSPENTCRILLGNKTDVEEWKVTKEEGQALADKYNIPFLLTSAKSGDNIEGVFDKIAQLLKIKIEKESLGANKETIYKNSVKLKNDNHFYG